MKFIREIPMSRVNQSLINDLQDSGFIVVPTADSIGVWVKTEEAAI